MGSLKLTRFIDCIELIVADSLAGRAELSHLNLNDRTVEGLEAPEARVFSVQYHPEASPGPQDSRYLFDRFVALMDKNA